MTDRGYKKNLTLARTMTVQTQEEGRGRRTVPLAAGTRRRKVACMSTEQVVETGIASRVVERKGKEAAGGRELVKIFLRMLMDFKKIIRPLKQRQQTKPM